MHRAEYVARRDAINAELSALAPAPIPDLDHAREVLEDFTIFWQKEPNPAAKRGASTMLRSRYRPSSASTPAAS
ncbi:MAG TPA: hypothetical protein VMF09_14125 [Solirubrobacteraceae bacterium]|nr:hypothetical protein [Solirubrobacteraceae bacterium]